MAAQRLSEQALAICGTLTELALARQTTTFGDLAILAGMGQNAAQAAGRIVSQVIAARCEARGTPPLTALVLNAAGEPPAPLEAILQARGLTLFQAQQDVFNFDWSGFCPSGPEGAV